MSGTEVVPVSEYLERLKRSKSEKLHDKFAFECRARQLPPFDTETRFAAAEVGFPRWRTMKSERAPSWRFDFCWPQFMLAVELEGLDMRRLFEIRHVPGKGETRKAVWVVYGRHATPDGIKDDMEKYNAAAQLGWTVLRFEQDAIKSSIAIDTTIRVLAARGWNR